MSDDYLNTSGWSETSDFFFEGFCGISEIIEKQTCNDKFNAEYDYLSIVNNLNVVIVSVSC